MGRVLVFGAGAIGQWLGAALAQAGEEVTLVTRAASCKAINERGLRCGLKTVRLKAFEEPPPGSYDLVLLTVKTFDIADALNILGSRLSFQNILTIQNGIGTDELVRSRFLSANLIVGSVTCSVASPEPGVLHPGLTGGLGLAPFSDASTAPFRMLFEKGGIKAESFLDFRSMKWSKLCLNVVGNALGALLDCTPSELFNDRKLYRFEVRALSEVRKIIRSQNLKIINLPDYPVKKFSEVMFWLPSRLSFPLLSEKMSRGRGDKPPSLLLELRRGRDKTEIDFLNGAVVEYGKKLGIPTPVNENLVCAYHEAMADPAAWWDRWRGKSHSLVAELLHERDLA